LQLCWQKPKYCGNSTQCSQAVSHPSTDQAQPCLKPVCNYASKAKYHNYIANIRYVNELAGQLRGLFAQIHYWCNINSPFFFPLIANLSCPIRSFTYRVNTLKKNVSKVKKVTFSTPCISV